MSATQAVLLALLTRLDDRMQKRSGSVDFFGEDGPLAERERARNRAIESNVDLPCGCYDERGALGFDECPKHRASMEVQ
jgi:hypothetical protein